MKLSISVIAMAALAHGAAADPYNAEVTLELVPTAADGAPQVQATIVNAGHVPLDQIKLIDDRGVTVRATSLRELKDGPDTLAFAIVVSSSEIMMGNDQFIPHDQNDSFFGYHAAIKAGLAAMDLPHTMPPGSRGMLITYDDHVRTVVPMGPIEKLDAASIGTQKDYYMRVGTELVSGVRTGLEALAATRANRKVLIVIGDGNDTNNETARPELAELKKRAAQERIETFALVYKSQLSYEGNVITTFVPTTMTLVSHDGIAAAMQTIVGRLADRYTVLFPGDELRWDGRSQDFTVQIGMDKLEPVTLYLNERDSASCSLLGAWWKQIAIGLALVGTIALLMRLRAGRAAA